MLCEMNRLLINTLDTHVIYLSFLQGSPEKSTFTNLSFIIFSVMNLYEQTPVHLQSKYAYPRRDLLCKAV